MNVGDTVRIKDRQTEAVVIGVAERIVLDVYPPFWKPGDLESVRPAFKVGDKVVTASERPKDRCNVRWSGSMDEFLGKTMTVIARAPLVALKEAPAYLWSPLWLRPALKVGDVVRVGPKVKHRHWYDDMDTHVGTVATVCRSGSWVVLDLPGRMCYWMPDWLVPADDAYALASKLYKE